MNLSRPRERGGERENLLVGLLRALERERLFNITEDRFDSLFVLPKVTVNYSEPVKKGGVCLA